MVTIWQASKKKIILTDHDIGEDSVPSMRRREHAGFAIGRTLSACRKRRAQPRRPMAGRRVADDGVVREIVSAVLRKADVNLILLRR
jgi:hypothetical protein